MPGMHGGRPTIEDIQPIIQDSLELREYKITDKNGKQIPIEEVARDLAEEFAMPGNPQGEGRRRMIDMQRERRRE